ncbi:MAG: hypothetical protein K0S47_1775 [Herbinix sp.]|jgi:hypothetical protein|nr:hypothetical protein [Herbinix sp.]
MFGPKKKIGLFPIIVAVIAVLMLYRLFIQNTSLFYRNFPDLPFSVHLNEQDIVLLKGEEFKLYVFGINKRISFSSTNFRVAGVNFNGKVTAHQVGKAFIKVKVDDKILKCRVRVVDLNKKKLTLAPGDSYHLKVKGVLSFPSYKSSNPEVAKITKFGKIKALRKGRTVITVKVKGKELSCTIKVE